MKIQVWFIAISLLATLYYSPVNSEEAKFLAPEGWHLTETDKLPPHVEFMVVGEGKLEFPPSMNLSTESYQGSLQDYIEIVKRINKKHGSQFKDLGKIKTDAGEGSLSQVDSISKWGPVRMMHVILVKDGRVYILTAAALKNEFASHYKEFFNSFRSFKITE
jgi:hypothetical protein